MSAAPKVRDDLDVLYRRHGASILRRARQLLGDDHDAEEAVHDVFLAYFRSPEQFEGRSAVTTWFYSATTHLCLNRLRDRRRRAALDAETQAPAGGDAGAGGSEPARAERLAILRQLVARMPAELAAAAVYHYVDEMTHDEIAEVLGCSRRHVGNLILRARSWVAEEVGP